MLDIQLISIWKAPRNKNSYINFHSHNYHELVYYSTGNGKTTIGDHLYTFKDNCFAIIPPHINHDEYHFADSEVICLEFSGTPDITQNFNKDSFNEIHKILNCILSEVKNQNYGYKDMITLKLNELQLHILRNENSSLDRKNFEYIINYIKENYHEKIILSECAKQLNISYDYFQHQFKKLTGYSPQQFLLKQRLAASEKMLKSSNLDCTEIACRCGFSTSAQYSALFKKEYKISPLQFRKRHT